jgi:hypothetical protein
VSADKPWNSWYLMGHYAGQYVTAPDPPSARIGGQTVNGNYVTYADRYWLGYRVGFESRPEHMGPKCELS